MSVLHKENRLNQKKSKNRYNINEDILYIQNNTFNCVNSILTRKEDETINDIIENNESIEGMKQNELEQFIIENIIKNNNYNKIDLSQIIKNKEIHSHIHNIIGKNFPLLEISRLIPNEKVVDITFLGIKQLNDLISKEFVDLFIGKLKEIINTNFNNNKNINSKSGRTIRSNYKHITFSIDNNTDISNKIFAGETSKIELINQVFNLITNEELNKSIQSSGKLNLNKKSLKKIIDELFDFGIGTSIVKEGGIKEKLKSFYMGEIASRNKADLNNLGENLNFSFSKIVQNSKEALEIENKIIDTFSGKKFIHDKTNFDIIINGKISPILLKYVRKGEKIDFNNDNSLEVLVNKYINNLTNGFDFISPVINIDEFNNVKKLNKQVHKGIIDTKYFLKTYKSTLSTETLKINSKGKKGMRVFIDIVDMGIMNINDFRTLAGKVVSGEITENNMKELLNAGSTATTKFQNLVNKIKKNYPDSKIALGGDEIFIFIPEINNSDTENKVITNISNSLEKNHLKGRISSSFNTEDEYIYEGLDSSTSINKIFEKKIEKLIHTSNKLENYNTLNTEPTVSNIYIENSKTNLVKKNLDYFLNIINKQINDLTLINLLNNHKAYQKIYYNLIDLNGNTINGSINLEFEKNNNFINIKIS